MEVNIKSGSNLPKVIWKVEVLKAVDDAKFQSKDGTLSSSPRGRKTWWVISQFTWMLQIQQLCLEDGVHLPNSDSDQIDRRNSIAKVEAYISTDTTDGLISRELILETDSDKHETKEADGVKAAIDNQTTMKTEPAIDPEEPTDEDMNTFFSSLESQLSSSKIVVSQEEAKEALS
ncbi:hypothetical protein V6N11_054172 [Hibiscus sabdariffa]|uniref:Uncharacterized protein n=1 Tax=Hibiscus sabdariffa TaxID=183260 RepID=A0ABR2S335_9ROSI